ncbi:hypothetical protein DXC36_10060, partial [Streptococcus parasanguinis]
NFIRTSSKNRIYFTIVKGFQNGTDCFILLFIGFNFILPLLKIGYILQSLKDFKMEQIALFCFL